MDNAPSPVYLLLLTRHRDYANDIWSMDSTPPDVGVFTDAWTAIDAARSKLGEVERVPLDHEDHAKGIVWIGRFQSMEAIVQRRTVWAAAHLTD